MNKTKINKVILLFLIPINALFTSILYLVKNIQGVNPYFIIFHLCGVIIVSALCYYLFRDESFSFSSKKIVSKSTLFVLLFLIIYGVASLLKEKPFGSVILLFVISIVSGSLTFILLDFPKRAGGLLYDPPLFSGFETKIKTTSLIFIFLLGFILRFLVLGLPKVPIGIDAPMYLLQALKASQTSISQLLWQGFSFSSQPYPDTVNFANLWLGLILKFLNLFHLRAEVISKFVMPFLSSLSIIALYSLVKSLTNRRIALYSSLIFAILPSELIFAQLYKEIFGQLWLLVALAFLVKYFKKESYPALVVFFTASFLLWKTAITSFATFSLFLLAYIVYLLLSKKTSKEDFKPFKATPLFTSLMPLSGQILSFGALFASINISYSRFMNAELIHPYSYYAFPLVSLTNLVLFLPTIFYFFKAYTDDLSKEEKSAVSFSFPIFISLFIFSFFVSCLLRYHLFPSSLYYYSLRFSLYLGIPFSIMGGLFLDKVKKKERRKNSSFFIFGIIGLLFMNFFLTALPKTTVHKSTLTPAISDSTYNGLNSLSLKEYHVVCYGNFSVDKYGLMARNLALSHWLKYMVYYKTGKEPAMMKSFEEVKKIDFQEKNNYLLLNCTDNSFIRVLTHEGKSDKFTLLKIIKR
jgi:hypothetical protein